MTDKDLDKEMAEIMDYEIGTDACCQGIWVRISQKDKQSDWFDFHPTQSILDAFQVVEKMVEDENSNFYEWQFELGNNHIKGKWYAVFSLPGTDREYYGFAETRAKAICLAAQAAIEARE